MIPTQHIITFLFLMILVAPTISYSEIVHFKNGETLEGTITHENDSSLTIEIQSSKMSFNRSEIDHIDYAAIQTPGSTENIGVMSPVPSQGTAQQQIIPQTTMPEELALSEELKSLVACFGTPEAFLSSVALWEKKAQENPTDSTTHYQLGIAYFYLRRYAEAITALNVAASQNEHDTEAALFIGYAQYKLGNLPQAIPAFEKRMSSRPYDHKTLSVLALTYYETNAIPQAIDAYEKLLTRGTLSKEFILSKLETLYERKGDTKKSALYKQEREKLQAASEAPAT